MKTRITGVTIEADSVVIKGADFDSLCAMARENEQLRGELSIAQEGLANVMQEIEQYRATLSGIASCATCGVCSGAAEKRLRDPHG